MATISNLGARQDLEIRQGATFLLAIALVQGAVPVPLTGCTLRAQMRKTGKATTIAATFTVVVTSAPGGTFTLGLAAATTAALECGESLGEAASQYQWDLEVEDAGGVVTGLLWGTVRVHREVTRV